MRIEKWGFLLTYAVYLVFCVCFSLVSKDEEAINSMIFAITIASTAFSISDLFFTKIDIDKKVTESLFQFYLLASRIKDFYLNEIEFTYQEMISTLNDLMKDNENEIENFFEGRLSPQQRENFINRIKTYNSDKLTEFVTNYLQSDKSNLQNLFSEYEYPKINTLINNAKTKQKNMYKAASLIAVLGLVALLIILTMRITATPYTNNILTISAFLFVIINLLTKEYYKSDSLKKIEKESKQIVEDLKNTITAKFQFVK